MNEDLELILATVEEDMDKAMSHYEGELRKIRAGKASPNMLDSVMVEAYGAQTKLNAVASVNVTDSRTIAVQPFDKSVLQSIERAIINSGLGFNPQSDGSIIRINVPPLTEERRRELVKMSKAESENAKISIRAARKGGNEEVKKLVKDGLAEDMGKDAELDIQKMTDKAIDRVDKALVEKEKEIMTV